MAYVLLGIDRFFRASQSVSVYVCAQNGDIPLAIEEGTTSMIAIAME